MKDNLVTKLLKAHLIEGELSRGKEIKIRIDQTLTQDSTGTMVYLQLEALGVREIKTSLSVAYIDHNTLQTGFENADDHRFIQSAAKKYGLYFSKAGGGICHQVHLEQFLAPGLTLLGSDSHTPTGGGMGALAIGAGGLDVAVAMATGTYEFTMPGVMGVNLVGSLPPWVSGKDVILKILSLLTVRGGVGLILEYRGEGVKSLSLSDRATIANMGAELGATTSVFPSDELTLTYLTRQGRAEDYRPLEADPGARYDESITIDLDTLEPLVALPHSPDRVGRIVDHPLKVDQVAIGSCTNSSYQDLLTVAKILKGRRVHPDVSLVIAPGSARVLRALSDSGALSDLIGAGARILEAACGPCIGMGQAPPSGGISLRTFNRNFKGRSGTQDAGVYLLSPAAAAISGITGRLTDPRILGEMPSVTYPLRFPPAQEYLIAPEAAPEGMPLVMGSNIKPFPVGEALADTLEKRVLLKLGDHVTTDDIMPSTAKLLPYRSNIPKLSEYCFMGQCPDFAKRAALASGGLVVGGENYGQGSSREHAALVPLYLGVKAVLAKSFARIHRSNLINSGILPLEFSQAEDYGQVGEGDVLLMENLTASLERGLAITVVNVTRDNVFTCRFTGSKRERKTLLMGGTVNRLRGEKA